MNDDRYDDPPRDSRDDYDDRPARRPRRDDYDDRPSERAPQKNGMATAGLVLGILALCGGITSIPGIICSAIGLSRVKTRGTGKGPAITGLVLSIAGIVLIGPAAILVGLMLPAVQKVREAAGRQTSTNNLTQIGIGMLNYEGNNGRLPPQAICDKNGKKLLSWRVTILPYIEQENLYAQFKLDEPWDSPNNKPLLKLMPKTYVTPSLANQQAEGLTVYKVFAGKNTAFALERVPGQPTLVNPWNITRLTATSRGTSNTVFCVEDFEPVPWTKPDDIDFNPTGPVPLKPYYPTGIMVLMGDGRVMMVRKGSPDSAWRASIDPKSASVESLNQ